MFDSKEVKLELIVTHDAEMIDYNADYMQCIGPTNILSFPTEDFQESYTDYLTIKEKPSIETSYTDLGTLILSVDTLEREAYLYGQEPSEHAIRLLAHGLVHLLGYDHGDEMQQLCQEIEKAVVSNNYTFTPFWSFCHD